MASAPSDDIVTIKKYANRRLYNTESSTYITLEHLAEMIRQKREFKVVDAKTGEDITHSILTQIIMEQESGGNPMLPVNFLRQLIGMYGDNMNSAVPQFLEESLAAFQRNQTQFRDALSNAMGAGAFTGGPFAELARRNMEMFTAAAAGARPRTESTEETDQKAELAELKAQLAALQSKLDKLGG